MSEISISFQVSEPIKLSLLLNKTELLVGYPCLKITDISMSKCSTAPGKCRCKTFFSVLYIFRIFNNALLKTDGDSVLA